MKFVLIIASALMMGCATPMQFKGVSLAPSPFGPEPDTWGNFYDRGCPRSLRDGYFIGVRFQYEF